MAIINKNPEYFLTIAQEQSVSKAAEKLYVSQSYLSQHLAKLENQLQAKLFDRSKNPIEITEEGRVYAAYLESCNQLYQKLMVDLERLNKNREQVLNLGLSNWRASTFMPEILPSFLAMHPTARVVIHERPVNEMYSMMAKNEIDLSIMNTTLDVPEYVTMETIAYENILLVGNRRNAMCRQLLKMQQQGMAVDLRCLEKERFILLQPELALAKRVNNYLDKKQVVLQNLIHTTNNITCLNLTGSNVGFCFLNETGLNYVPNEEDLVFFDLQSSDLRQPLSAVYKKGSYMTPLVRDFLGIAMTFYRDMEHEDIRVLPLRTKDA